MSQTGAEDLAALRDAAEAWVQANAPVEADPRAARAQAAERWKAIGELGWPGVAAPEDVGGLGLGPAAVGVLLETLAGPLATTPLLSCGLLATEALRIRTGEAAALLGSLAAGETVIAFAVEEGPRHDPSGPSTRAYAADGGWRLDGRKRFVLDAPAADVLLVSALADGETDLFLVPVAEAASTPLDMIDGRAFADVRLEGAKVQARLHIGQAGVERLCDLARAGLAAEMLGAADQALKTTVEYLKLREQFGRPIGSFQALQHRAAQVLVEVELARSAVTAAWSAAEAGSPDFARLAVLAKFTAGEAVRRASGEMVQMHGGIGMTAEHPAGRYLKWARVSETLFGDAAWCAERYATLSGY